MQLLDVRQETMNLHDHPARRQVAFHAVLTDLIGSTTSLPNTYAEGEAGVALSGPSDAFSGCFAAASQLGEGAVDRSWSARPAGGSTGTAVSHAGARLAITTVWSLSNVIRAMSENA